MTTRSCELLGNDRDTENVLIGTITLKDGKLSYKAEKGSEIEMKNVMAQSKEEDPTKWFNDLPWNFNGIALRARLLKKGDRPWKTGGPS